MIVGPDKHGLLLPLTFANEPGSFQWFKLLERGGRGGGGGQLLPEPGNVVRNPSTIPAEWLLLVIRLFLLLSIS